jgi:hypothetical protein
VRPACSSRDAAEPLERERRAALVAASTTTSEAPPSSPSGPKGCDSDNAHGCAYDNAHGCAAEQEPHHLDVTFQRRDYQRHVDVVRLLLSREGVEAPRCC